MSATRKLPDTLPSTLIMGDEDDRLAVAAPQQESPTSRFTAVNGKEQPPANGNGNGNGPPSRRNSDERVNGQPRITPPGQEKLKISTSTPRDDWGAVNGERPYHQGPSYPDTDGSHKRKRSDPNCQNSSANPYPHTLPGTPHPSSSTKQTPTTATTEGDTPRDQNMSAHSGHPHYSSEGHYHDSDNVPDSAIPDNAPSAVYGGEAWHSRYQHGHMSSDERLSEALRRETQNMDAQQREYEDGSPDDDRSANPYDSYGNDRREMSVQSDPKKRKRNFSNRTKTGCMTCRRRKKKCDETKPECEY